MTTSFAGIVAYVIGILNQLVLVLGALALLLFMWGVFQYIYGAARGKQKNRQTITWGLLTLFILFSIWGILRLACDSFLGVGLCGGANNSTGVNGYIAPGYVNTNSFGGPR